MIKKELNTSERLSGLEAEVRNIRSDVNHFGAVLEKIQDSLSNSKQTNWSLVISGVFLGLALWAAFVRPINADVERQALSATKIAEAVLIQDDKIRALQIDQSRSQAEHTALVSIMNDVQAHGSPITQQRLTLVEFKIDQIVKGGVLKP